MPAPQPATPEQIAELHRKSDAVKTKINAMTMEQRRARLAEIEQMAKRGNFDYEYGEVVLLTTLIPEELVKREAAEKRTYAAAKRRAKKQGLNY